MTAARRGSARKPLSRSRKGQGSGAREKLIHAAIKAFAEKGYHGTKISDIVAGAGYTQPTFYLHFSSKQAIYQYLIDRVRTELREVISGARISAVSPMTDVREKLNAAIRAFLQYFVDNPNLASIGYFDLERNAGLRDEIIALVSRNIAFEQGAGYCRTDLDPVFLSECYNGSLERLIRVYLLTGKLDASALAEKIADLYGYGTIPDRARS